MAEIFDELNVVENSIEPIVINNKIKFDNKESLAAFLNQTDDGQLKNIIKMWEESDGRKRDMIIELDNYRFFTITVTCTLSEANEMQEWMQNNGLEEQVDEIDID